MTPASLSAVMLVPSVPQLEQQRLRVLPMLGSPAQWRGLTVELHRHGRKAVGRLPVDHHLADVAVRLHLWIVEQLRNGLHRGPGGVEIGESSAFHSA